jgi:hypothetical protein
MENGYGPERQGCDHYRRRPRHGRSRGRLFAAQGAKVAADEASFVTGAELVIDGGFIAQ